MFTLDLLPGKYGSFLDGVIPGYKYYGHFGEHGVADALPQCFVVTPLRSYEAVRRSWLRNRRDVSELEWLWEAMLSRTDVFFLPLDTPERDERLASLSSLIGVRLQTNWEPSNSTAYRDVQ